MMIGLMVLSVVMQLVGIIVQVGVMNQMRQQLAVIPGAADMQVLFGAMMVFGLVMGLGFCGLFGWIAKRLTAPEVAAEFR